MAPAKHDVDLTGNAQITGTLYLESGVKLDSDKNTRIGAIKNADLSALQKMVLDQINTDTHLAATQKFDEIRRSQVIQGSGKTNVIAVEGDISLSGKDSLILTGGMSDVFILNVTGEIDLSGQASIQVSGGALASNVYIHILGPDEKHLRGCSDSPHGGDLKLTGQSNLEGNVFVFNGKTDMSGNAVVHGTIAAEGQVELTGQAEIVGDSNYCPGRAPASPPDGGKCKCDDDDRDGYSDKGGVKASCDRDDGDDDQDKCKCDKDDDDGYGHGDGDDHRY